MILDIPMPKKCVDCPCYDKLEDWCRLANRDLESVPYDFRASWCPAREGT